MKKVSNLVLPCLAMVALISCSLPRAEETIRLEIYRDTPGNWLTVNSSTYVILTDPALLNFRKSDYQGIYSARLVAQICSDLAGVNSTVALYDLTNGISLSGSAATTSSGYPNWQTTFSENFLSELPDGPIDMCLQVKNDDGSLSTDLAQAYLEIKTR